MKQSKHGIAILALAISLTATCTLGADSDPAIEGIFGLSDVEENTALAFWVSLGEGDKVAGVRWFNNDEYTVFPELLAVAGDSEYPELLADATVVDTAVSGGSMCWSYVEFDQPLATDADGIYLIWKLPDGGEFAHSGTCGGAGFGFHDGDLTNRCWVAAGSDDWESLTTDHQMAVVAVMESEKAADVLFLQQPGVVSGDREDSSDDAIPSFAADRLSVFPNPFNPATSIRFSLDFSGQGSVVVYDLKGRVVRDLYRGHLAEGISTIDWDGSLGSGIPAASGVYLVRVKCGEFEASRTITLTK